MENGNFCLTLADLAYLHSKDPYCFSSQLSVLKTVSLLTALHYAQDNLGVNLDAPSKNPSKCPITYVFCSRRKKIIARTFRISGTLIVTV